MTMVWALPPLLGFFLSPFLGSVSDRCRLGYGRRRPAIILLSILLVFGMFLVPYGHHFGELLGDIPEQGKVQFSVIITIIGIIFIDFNADCIQTPARAYALDITIPSQQTRIINTFSTMSGVGGVIGYAFGAIDWMATPFGELDYILYMDIFITFHFRPDNGRQHPHRVHDDCGFLLVDSDPFCNKLSGNPSSTDREG